MSTAYYDANAAAYYAATIDADVADLRARFIKHLKPGARVLDAGCGSGRDAKAFLDAGFAVSAFDGSAEMVRLASTLTGLAVTHLRFQQLEAVEEFDGIWACASLLHVPRKQLGDVFARLKRALRPSGVVYVSFKLGTETREMQDRTFTDLTADSLENLAEAAGFNSLEVWLTDDVRPGRSDRWLNALLKAR